MRTTIVAFICGAVVLALGAPSSLWAQDEEAPPAEASWETWEEAVDGFFARLEAGEGEGAVGYLYAGYPWRESLGEQVSQLESRFAALPDLMGAFLGHERLAVQPLSERYVYVWHLVFYERQPLQFHFSFYKPQDRWVIHQFAYDEGLNEIAREMARRSIAGE